MFRSTYFSYSYQINLTNPQAYCQIMSTPLTFLTDLYAVLSSVICYYEVTIPLNQPI